MSNFIKVSDFLYNYKYIQHNFFYSLQENDDVVRLVEEKHIFNKLHERKTFLVSKQCKHPTDLFVDIKHGKLDSILNCQNAHKDLIQIGNKVKSERITEKGELQKAHFMC